MHLNDQNDTAAVYSDVKHENSILFRARGGHFEDFEVYFKLLKKNSTSKVPNCQKIFQLLEIFQIFLDCLESGLELIATKILNCQKIFKFSNIIFKNDR